MQTLGVSRFTIEGEPGGPVVFVCLIPVAGRQAVTERFEAEADDVIQAAQAALAAHHFMAGDPASATMNARIRGRRTDIEQIRHYKA